MGGFTAALALLGIIVVVLAGVYAAGELAAVARPGPPAVPFAGGFAPQEHAMSRFHVRWYVLTMIFLAFVGDHVIPSFEGLTIKYFPTAIT